MLIFPSDIPLKHTDYSHGDSTENDVRDNGAIRNKSMDCNSQNWMRNYGSLKTILTKYIIRDLSKLCLDFLEFHLSLCDLDLYDKYRPKTIFVVSRRNIPDDRFPYSDHINANALWTQPPPPPMAGVTVFMGPIT